MPEHWKTDIDTVLATELLAANRHYAEAVPELALLVQLEAARSPETFYRTLRSRWNWHNRFYEALLAPALPFLLEAEQSSLSPRQVMTIRQVYEAASLVDQATLVPSAAIKRHVDRWVSKMNLRGDERFLAITPPRETFWAQYRIDHMEYLIAQRTENANRSLLKAALLSKYHANDPTIFSSRFEEEFANLAEDSICNLERKIAQLRIGNDYKVKHFYFTIERPRLRALSNVLVFDNLEEYVLLKSLIGISGFVLRKFVLKYISDSGILPNNGAIYGIGDEAVLNAIDRLAEAREKTMSKELVYYKQTGLTCGAACLMMALHYFGRSDLDRKTEHAIHYRTRATYAEGNHFSALAAEAASTGLEVRLFHSETAMFVNNGMMPNALFEDLYGEYCRFLQAAIEHGATVENGSPVDVRRIRELIRDDYLVILAGSLGGVLHAVLVHGFDEDKLVLCDPLSGRREMMGNERFDRFSRTGIGSWMLAIREPQGTVNDLVGELDHYKGEARSHLDRR